MAARIQNATSQPDITAGVQHLFKAVYAGGVPPQMLELVHLLTLAAWYEDPRFDDPERAALALTEAATRLCDRPGRGHRRDLGRGCETLRRAATRLWC